MYWEISGIPDGMPSQLTNIENAVKKRMDSKALKLVAIMKNSFSVQNFTRAAKYKPGICKLVHKIII